MHSDTYELGVVLPPEFVRSTGEVMSPKPGEPLLRVRFAVVSTVGGADAAAELGGAIEANGRGEGR